MRSIDFLIVGSGIAGLTIADHLENENQSILIVDPFLEGHASQQSSGVINPITGRRFVKSWNYEILKNYFLEFYSRIELKLNIKCIQEFKLIQKLNSPDEENQWLARTADPEYSGYLDEFKATEFQGTIHSKNQIYCLIKSMYVVDVNVLLNRWKEYFKSKSLYSNLKFDYCELSKVEHGYLWGDHEIKRGIIFCEGFRVVENPYFSWLPIFKLKGEFLEFKAPLLNLDFVYKSEYVIVPLGNHRYWCGSNFDLQDASLKVTKIELQKQIEFLKANLKVPFEIEYHGFGIRPSSRDRRPVVGAHPGINNMFILNGLGTKGFSIAPFCSKNLVNNILFNKEILHTISINRFLQKGFIPQNPFLG
ncbi:MAG: FAD-dependent oxidoreductase [Saprospiraceae bacterium]